MGLGFRRRFGAPPIEYLARLFRRRCGVVPSSLRQD